MFPLRGVQISFFRNKHVTPRTELLFFLLSSKSKSIFPMRAPMYFLNEHSFDSYFLRCNHFPDSPFSALILFLLSPFHPLPEISFITLAAPGAAHGFLAFLFPRFHCLMRSLFYTVRSHNFFPAPILLRPYCLFHDFSLAATGEASLVPPEFLMVLLREYSSLSLSP